MEEFTLKISHLFILNLFILSVMSYAVDPISLCSALDGSLASTDDHRIFYKDKDFGITTIEVNGTIVGCYPDPLTADASATTNRSFTPDLSKCADQNEIFCTKDDTYPIDYIQHLLRKHWHILSYAFGSDAQVIDDNIIDPVIMEIETDVCESREEIVYPTIGQIADGTNLYILNTPEQKQGLSVNVCESQHYPCRMADNFPKYYRTECQQHYIYRELLALSPDGVPVKEKFKFPAFCTCTFFHTE